MTKYAGEEFNMRNLEQPPVFPSSLEKNKGVFPFATATSAPEISTKKAPPEIKEPPKKKKLSRKTLGVRLAGAALVSAGIAGPAIHHQITTETELTPPAISRDITSIPGFYWDLSKGPIEDIQRLFTQQKPIQEGSLAPKSGEVSPGWKILSEQQIRELAEIPKINMIGDRYLSTVTSVLLKAKANQAGYTLIYQGDSNDTVGRTVIAKGRRPSESKNWTLEDNGFGRAGAYARGIFKAWVPDPSDPLQKERIYALFQDPATKKEFVVSLHIFPANLINVFSSENAPTRFAVDDLNNGPAIIQQKIQEAGFDISTFMLPTADDPPTRKWRRPIEFPTIYDLVRKQGLNFLDLVKPGDYVVMGMDCAYVDETITKDYVYRVNSLGISTAGTFTVRRFGGEKQWQSEIKK